MTTYRLMCDGLTIPYAYALYCSSDTNGPAPLPKLVITYGSES
jgi:hypothetical protein